jgi:hypothetical protein
MPSGPQALLVGPWLARWQAMGQLALLLQVQVQQGQL